MTTIKPLLYSGKTPAGMRGSLHRLVFGRAAVLAVALVFSLHPGRLIASAGASAFGGVSEFPNQDAGSGPLGASAHAADSAGGDYPYSGEGSATVNGSTLNASSNAAGFSAVGGADADWSDTIHLAFPADYSGDTEPVPLFMAAMFHVNWSDSGQSSEFEGRTQFSMRIDDTDVTYDSIEGSTGSTPLDIGPASVGSTYVTIFIPVELTLQGGEYVADISLVFSLYSRSNTVTEGAANSQAHLEFVAADFALNFSGVPVPAPFSSEPALWDPPEGVVAYGGDVFVESDSGLSYPVIPMSSVPEPQTVALLVVGAFLGLLARKRAGAVH